MRIAFWPIYKRELKSYARSSSTYIALALLFLIAGASYQFMIGRFVYDSAMAAQGGPFFTADEAPNITRDVIELTFNLLSALILFTIPILSMGLIASERSSGTFEVLVTCPLSDWSIILGKYFALVTVGAAVVLFSSAYPAMTYYLGWGQGATPELPIVITCYLGLFLIFATYAAFGVMASSFTDSQVTASIVTLLGLLLWYSIATFNMPNQTLQRIVDELSALNHTEDFIAGLLTLKDLAFYVIASFVCLFIASRVLEARRWRI